MSLIEELATALQAVGTLKAVGEQWISFDGSIPNGGVPFCGQIVTREMYPDLWNLMNKNGRVKTETDWQAHAKANGGTCSYYSSGDGSTTFRMPNVCNYLRAGNVGEVGKYTEEGLPNITGTFPNNDYVFDKYYSGAMYPTSTTHGGYQDGNGECKQGGFDASRSNPIYGNSDHVTLKTYNVLVGVYAVGIVTNVGATELETIRSALAKLEASAVKTVNNTAPMNGNVNIDVTHWGMPTDKIQTTTSTFTAEKNGFYCATRSGTGAGKILINGVEWCGPNDYSTGFIPFKAGDTITTTGLNNQKYFYND